MIVKLLFFSALPNKSYASMAKMKAVQPEMTSIRERRLFSFVAQSRKGKKDADDKDKKK